MSRWLRWVALAAAAASVACAPWWGSPVRRAERSQANLTAAGIPLEIDRWEGAARHAPSDVERARALLHLALLRSHPANPQPDYPGALEALEAFQDLAQPYADDVALRRLEAVLSELGRCERRGERRREVADLLGKEELEVRRRLEALRRDSRGMAAVVELLVEEGRVLGREKERLQSRNEELALRQRQWEERAAQLARENAELVRENAELKETLERLKTLDLQLERQRTGTDPR